MHKQIAIIGAGFSGAATVIHLLMRHCQKSFEVVLINCHANLARGVAYRTHSRAHLLNVPAGRMSVFPERSVRCIPAHASRSSRGHRWQSPVEHFDR